MAQADWKFLSNHGQALVYIAADPGIRLRDIAERIGVTERAAHRIVKSLVESGYIARERVGRRNSYEVRTDLPVVALERDIHLSDLLDVLGVEPVAVDH